MVTVADPPLHAIVLCATLAVIATGAVIVTSCSTLVQPFASFTTIWYGPAPNPLNTLLAWYVTPLSFEYVNVPVPLLAVTVISPSVDVAQLNCDPL
jgi:hypothetical protein